MVKYDYQTSLRMSDAMREDLATVCERFGVNESDVIRKSLVEFVERVNQNPDQSRYLFV